MSNHLVKIITHSLSELHACMWNKWPWFISKPSRVLVATAVVLQRAQLPHHFEEKLHHVTKGHSSLSGTGSTV